jgi:hypothetical protein
MSVGSNIVKNILKWNFPLGTTVDKYKMDEYLKTHQEWLQQRGSHPVHLWTLDTTLDLGLTAVGGQPNAYTFIATRPKDSRRTTKRIKFIEHDFPICP